jgi:hypothetical protein
MDNGKIQTDYANYGTGAVDSNLTYNSVLIDFNGKNAAPVFINSRSRNPDLFYDQDGLTIAIGNKTNVKIEPNVEIEYKPWEVKEVLDTRKLVNGEGKVFRWHWKRSGTGSDFVCGEPTVAKLAPDPAPPECNVSVSPLNGHTRLSDFCIAERNASSSNTPANGRTPSGWDSLNSSLDERDASGADRDSMNAHSESNGANLPSPWGRVGGW